MILEGNNRVEHMAEKFNPEFSRFGEPGKIIFCSKSMNLNCVVVFTP